VAKVGSYAEIQNGKRQFRHTHFLRQNYLVQVQWVFLSDKSHPSELPSMITHLRWNCLSTIRNSESSFVPNSELFEYENPVVLLGGGPYVPEHLQKLLQKGYSLIAADGGANHLINKAAASGATPDPVRELEPELTPELIIGDLDSLIEKHIWEPLTNVVRITEQDTTDFEKCLYSVSAPLYLALGFIGNRLDHTLAALNALAKTISDKSVILVAEDDVVIVCRGDFSMTLSVGMRLSIFPLEQIQFSASVGLRYALHGLTLAPTSMVGVSNEVSESWVHIEVEPVSSSGIYAVILPVSSLDQVLADRS